MTSHDCCQSRANIGMFFDFFARVPCVTCQCSPYQRSPFDLIELLEKEVLKSKVAVEGISVILTFQANTCRVFLENNETTGQNSLEIRVNPVALLFMIVFFCCCSF